ncbi:hypothetical protein AB0L05_28695 [Nonomuraea pusilla]|uniref:hypothetical protein n=1 Tax=Nonomuraea pusilla TaxID=46177 RepID=UPI00332C58FA
MAAARRARPLRVRRAPAPVVVHTAPLVLPVSAEPLRDGAVAVRGDRVLLMGPRSGVLASCPGAAERRWPGMIVAGLVDACPDAAAPGPGVTARARVPADAPDPSRLPGVSYVEVTGEDERAWEERGRDAVITAIREVDRPCPVGLAARTHDPHVLEDVAVLARTFGLRLLADLDSHATAELDEAGVLGPHAHVTCSRPLDPGERKLLRLRGTAVALRGPWAAADALPLLEEGNAVAFAGDPLAGAVAIKDDVRARRLRVRGLDRRLVEAATAGGAAALGMRHGPGRSGVLEPGSRADFAVFDARGRYPYAALLARPTVLGTVVGGVLDR